jgi:hypothetical protein
MTEALRLLRSAMARAVEGVMPKVSIVVAILTTLGALVFALGAHGAHGEAASRVAPFAAGLLAWGGGVLLCFASSIRAFDRDRDDGWDLLLARHGVRISSYLVARISGLAVVTGLLVAPGTFVVALGELLAARDAPSAHAALAGMFAGVVYAVAFSAVVAPIALAALGARNRASGYLFLLGVLVVPALVSEWTGQFFPDDWSELVSVPGALDALRDAALGAEGARALRAIVVLASVFVIASLWARSQLRLHRSAT